MHQNFEIQTINVVLPFYSNYVCLNKSVIKTSLQLIVI